MSVRLLFIFFASVVLSSCWSRTPAPVVHYGQSSGAGSAGIHTVAKGDTLYSIANRYRIPMRDIVVLNNIRSPFTLYVGQRVKLPPPQEYRVKRGDTLYGVSRLFGVNSSEVARLNNIGSPYILKIGQILRMPSVISKAKTSSVAKTSTASVKPVNRTALAEENKASAVSRASMTKDGVPVPGKKPMKGTNNIRVAQNKTVRKSVKISKVTTKTPKRSSSKFLKPVNGKVISSFGAKKNGLHNDGINIKAAKGASVKAAENGVVVYAGNALKASGNLILVRHENQWMTAYAHLDKIKVKKGQVIKRGEIIGKVGSTGSVATPQLHFEVRRGTTAINPNKYM